MAFILAINNKITTISNRVKAINPSSHADIYRLKGVLATFYSLKGLCCQNGLGDLDGAIEDHLVSLEIRKENDIYKQTLSIYTGITYLNIGKIHLIKGDYVAAELALNESLNVYKNYMRLHPCVDKKTIMTLSTVHYFLGKLLEKKIDLDAAIVHYKAALEIESEHYGNENNDSNG